MKTRHKVLDVDFIGGQGSLTETEEKALSEFLKKKKTLHSTKTHSNKTQKKNNQTVNAI